MKPQVKETEKSRVLMSKDYSMFDFPDFKVSKKHLERLKDSIQVKNLCKDYPIIVSPNTYRIIEGRYRFLACYYLQLPIHYKVAEVTTHKDAVRIKSIHKNIAIEDVVRLHHDNTNYHNITALHDEFNGFFSFKSVCTAIKECRFSSASMRMDRQRFDSGNLGLWDYNSARNRLIRVKDFLHSYSEFGWGIEDAFAFMDDGPIEFTDNQKTALTKAREYMWQVNLKTPIGHKINMSAAYRVIEAYMNRKGMPLSNYEIGCLIKVGFSDVKRRMNGYA